jgi:putative FmdB family regulatory protein
MECLLLTFAAVTPWGLPDPTGAIPMPRYDYRCRACDARFEVRRSLDEPETAVLCPDGHAQTTRVFTAVAVGGASAPAPTGGGCCGGGCCG